MCGSNGRCLNLGPLLHERQQLYIPTSIRGIALTQAYTNQYTGHCTDPGIYQPVYGHCTDPGIYQPVYGHCTDPGIYQSVYGALHWPRHIPTSIRVIALTQAYTDQYTGHCTDPGIYQPVHGSLHWPRHIPTSIRVIALTQAYTDQYTGHCTDPGIYRPVHGSLHWPRHIPTSTRVIALTQAYYMYLRKVFTTVKKVCVGRSWYVASLRFIAEHLSARQLILQFGGRIWAIYRYIKKGKNM